MQEDFEVQMREVQSGGNGVHVEFFFWYTSVMPLAFSPVHTCTCFCLQTLGQKTAQPMDKDTLETSHPCQQTLHEHSRAEEIRYKAFRAL